jgi:hypothetical protein
VVNKIYDNTLGDSVFNELVYKVSIPKKKKNLTFRGKIRQRPIKKPSVMRLI